MESATLGQASGGIQVEDKGLKKNAISFVSNIVISVASVAPGYSLAATLGFIAAVPALGVQSPAVIAGTAISWATGAGGQATTFDAAPRGMLDTAPLPGPM